MTKLSLNFDRILLCGFSGAGKSFVLDSWKENKKFSENFRLIDLDDLVFLALNLNSSSDKKRFFSDSLNVEHFRKVESDTLEKLLKTPEKQIIALGGGTLNQTAIDLIKSNEENRLIFIDTAFEECLKVIQSDQGRFLSQFNPSELLKLYQDRLKFYREAHLKYTANQLKNIDGPQSFSI